MTLLHFPSEIDTNPGTIIRVETPVMPVRARAKVHQDEVAMAFLSCPAESWTWENLRDYVAAEMIKRWGLFPRDPKKEYGIFHSFLGRWANAVAIARFAYDVYDGKWRGGPVKMQRFCKNSDPYFAQPISEYLLKHT